MAKLPIHFNKYIKVIAQHVAPPHPESSVPLDHHGRHANDAWNLLIYTERHLRRARVDPLARDRHMHSLRVMVLLSLVESFERLLKELAALCVDQVFPFIVDDRLNIFSPTRGVAFASTFGAGGSLGMALCEPLTWCDCDDANERFRRILSPPYEIGKFYVFPKDNQPPTALSGRYSLMSIVWQLRHAIVHNSGLLTPSDAHKLRVLCKVPVSGPNRLDPTQGDVWYIKLFLDETAELINTEVGRRLTELLTTVHADDPTLFVATDKAQELANLFRREVTIGGELRSPATAPR
jgi:hypothetical protein